MKGFTAYIAGRISALKQKIENLESPLMMQALQQSAHLQAEYRRYQIELEVYENMAIMLASFTTMEHAVGQTVKGVITLIPKDEEPF
jgi:hypothetical protein